MKFSTLKTAALLAMVASGATFAQTKAPEPDYTLSYNVAGVTDYRFRGISQTSLKPALQVGVDYANKNGFYLGAFGSNVKWVKDFNGATKGGYEVDLYGGYKGSITKDVGFDVGLITYLYPGNNSGAVGTNAPGAYSNANTTEIYGALSYNVFTFKYNRSVGNYLGFLKSSGSEYFDLSANFDLGSGFTLTPHAGLQKIPNQGVKGISGNYADYALTLGKDFGNGFSGTAAVMGTTAKSGPNSFYRDFNGKFIGNSTVVVGVKYSF